MWRRRFTRTPARQSPRRSRKRLARWACEPMATTLQFTAVFKQIRVVVFEAGEGTQLDAGKAKVVEGKKTRAEVQGPQEYRSWAKSGTDLFNLTARNSGLPGAR